MKLLRETIRKILLENMQEYEPIIKMLCSDNKESISQALELSGDLKLVSDVSYQQDSKGDPINMEKHVWEFTPTEELMSEIEARWSTKSRTSPSYADSMHSIFPVGSTGRVKILLGIPIAAK